MADDVKRMYIKGQWVLAEGGSTFDVINPADQSVVAKVEQRRRARDPARGGSRPGRVPRVVGAGPKDRGRILLNIQELMEERRDELARLVTLENGKPFEEAKKEVSSRWATSAGSPKRRGG